VFRLRTQWRRRKKKSRVALIKAEREKPSSLRFDLSHDLGSNKVFKGGDVPFCFCNLQLQQLVACDLIVGKYSSSVD